MAAFNRTFKSSQVNQKMVLETLKRWLGGDEVSDYERRTLTEEYRRLASKIRDLERRLDSVHCTSCATKENPKAKRLIARKREHEDRQAEIEARLGQKPAVKATSSRRSSKRASS